MCPFCRLIATGQFVIETEHAVAFADAFPVSPGHTLIVPRRHEADLFALPDVERAALWALVPDVKRHIERTSRPNGYNIGVNAGVAAGQTVAHAHLHVIPRYTGDVADSRGGVRWVIPSRAAFWQDHEGR
jgi:diadenosine tetraphosphate (Ap4A) HIT family hydrolase